MCLAPPAPDTEKLYANEVKDDEGFWLFVDIDLPKIRQGCKPGSLSISIS